VLLPFCPLPDAKAGRSLPSCQVCGAEPGVSRGLSAGCGNGLRWPPRCLFVPECFSLRMLFAEN